MSGVKNLRAMFEQKGDALPDRGRSPPGPGGFATPSPSASPRPLSKVRTAFVMIEKDGRMGLRREPSGESVSASSRRPSNETDATTSQPITERSDVFSDNVASAITSLKMNLSREAIPESPKQDIPAKVSPKKELKPSLLAPNANPDKVMDEEEPHTKMLSGNPTELSATRLGGTILDGGIGDALNGTRLASTKAKTQTAAKPAPKKTAPISTAKTATKASKSPVTAKAPSAKEPAKVTSSSANPRKAPVNKTASKPAPIDLPPSGIGFVKPKPKSPTRPVKLPSSLTTHTASSAQKFGGGNAAPASRQSLSRASGNAQQLSVNPATHRSPSRNSVSTTSTTTAKTLKHKPSSANVGRSSRPSIGPPPKPVAKEQPPSKRESHVDEGFLARMMRPTQSSAKKTSEKAPVTPPRKQNASVKRPTPKDVGNEAKKTVAKTQTTSAQVKSVRNPAKPAAVAAKENTTTKEVAPAVAHTETAETAIEITKLSTDTAEASIVKNEESEAETASRDDVSTATQDETVEDTVETAETDAVDATTADTPSVGEVEVAEAQPASEPAISPKVEASEPAPSVLAVTEEPLKVEDIEDVVQEAQEPSHQLRSTEVADAAPQETTPETNESIVAPEEEPNVDVTEAGDETLKLEETVADVKEVEAEETKSNGPTTVDNPPNSTNEDIIDEAAVRDATAAAL